MTGEGVTLMSHGTRSRTSLVSIKQPTNQKGRCVVFRNPHHRPSSNKTPSFRATVTAGVVSIRDASGRYSAPSSAHRESPEATNPTHQTCKLSHAHRVNPASTMRDSLFMFNFPATAQSKLKKSVLYFACPAMPYSGNPVAVHSTQVP